MPLRPTSWNLRSKFRFVKNLTYCLLFANVIFFLIQEIRVLEHTFGGALTTSHFIQVFSATIDTATWLFLLILFEIETSKIGSGYLEGNKKLVIRILRVICYLLICYAWLGYFYELLTVYNIYPISKNTLCVSPYDWSFLVGIDEYVSLDIESCNSLSASLVQITPFKIVADLETLEKVQYLTWVDLINASAWILIVMILELEVFFLGRKFGEITLSLFLLIKTSLYLILFFAAIYWGIFGNFIDFWDAALWLFAFLFIELNLLKLND